MGYNRFKVLSELVPLTIFPQVRSAKIDVDGADRWVVPFLTLVSMGAPFDMFLALRVRKAAASTVMPSSAWVISGLAEIVDHLISARDVILTYIYFISRVSTSEDVANGYVREVVTHWLNSGLPS